MAKRTRGGEEIDPSVYATNYTEFTLKKDASPKILLIRVAMLAAYIAIALVIFLKLWWLGALVALVFIAALYFTWPLTNIEHQYTLSSGGWKFETSYGPRSVVALEVKIKDMKKIAPIDSDAEKLVKTAKVYDFRSSPKQKEDIYYAVFEEGGKDSIILFQCTNKALKIFKSYNKENTVVVDTLRY
ncbi:MAG: hypothetical protein IKL24_06370 [Clostridia bacterium]|nr:hypothetical protein [Clostridia bacterium]